MRFRLLNCLILLFALISSSSAQAKCEPVARVRTVSGGVQIVADGHIYTVRMGQILCEQAWLSLRADGEIRIDYLQGNSPQILLGPSGFRLPRRGIYRAEKVNGPRLTNAAGMMGIGEISQRDAYFHLPAFTKTEEDELRLGWSARNFGDQPAQILVRDLATGTSSQAGTGSAPAIPISTKYGTKIWVIRREGEIPLTAMGFVERANPTTITIPENLAKSGFYRDAWRRMPTRIVDSDIPDFAVPLLPVSLISQFYARLLGRAGSNREEGLLINRHRGRSVVEIKDCVQKCAIVIIHPERIVASSTDATGQAGFDLESEYVREAPAFIVRYGQASNSDFEAFSAVSMIGGGIAFEPGGKGTEALLSLWLPDWRQVDLVVSRLQILQKP